MSSNSELSVDLELWVLGIREEDDFSAVRSLHDRFEDTEGQQWAVFRTDHTGSDVSAGIVGFLAAIAPLKALILHRRKVLRVGVVYSSTLAFYTFRLSEDAIRLMGEFQMETEMTGYPGDE